MMKQILLIYPAMIPSVRLCALEQFTFLAEAGKILFRAVPSAGVSDETLGWADAVVFVRNQIPMRRFPFPDTGFSEASTLSVICAGTGTPGCLLF